MRRKIVAMTRTISKTVMIFFCLSAVSSALIMFIAVRYSLTGDLTEFVLPWFTQLTQHGLQAISGASILTSTPIRLQGGKRNSRGGASDVFGSGAWATPAIDVKSLHGKIGELTLENDFLQSALTKAGVRELKACKI